MKRNSWGCLRVWESARIEFTGDFKAPEPGFTARESVTKYKIELMNAKTYLSTNVVLTKLPFGDKHITPSEK